MKSLYTIKNVNSVRKHVINDVLTLYRYDERDYISYKYLDELKVRRALLRVLIEDLGCLTLLEDENVVLVPLDDVMIVQSDIVYEAFTISEKYIPIKEKRIDAVALANLARVKELFYKHFK